VEDSACNTGDCGSMPTVLSYIKSYGSLGPDRDNTFEQGDEWMESVMNFWETEIWINMESKREMSYYIAKSHVHISVGTSL
jgi:uncharacterized protein with von Willebrand factor type A (vWA) domain